MWNGTEWIPATQPQNVVPTEQIDQTAIENAATQVGVPAQQVAAVAPHFDLNQDGQIDQNEMMQAAQSVSNPVNIPTPTQASMGIPAQGGAPNMGDVGIPTQGFAATPKKVFDWKDKKVLLIGGIVTVTVAIGVLVFFLLSGNPVAGTWVNNYGSPDEATTTYNKDGTIQSEDTTGALTWETDGDKLIQIATSTLQDGEKTTVTQTAQYELTNDNNVLWINLISMVDQDGNNMMIWVNPSTGNETELEFPCFALLRDSAQGLLDEQADWVNLGEPVPSYQSSKPSWCT
ncbi:MAG: hypothetical protein CMA27_05910 [Euryarchaeota archaeon]|nr:hypothetical protein [Euryarchaeota archaeon]